MQKQTCSGSGNFVLIFCYLLHDMHFLICQELLHVDSACSRPVVEQRMELSFTVLVLLVCDLVFSDNVFLPFECLDIPIILEIGKGYHDVVVHFLSNCMCS